MRYNRERGTDTVKNCKKCGPKPTTEFRVYTGTQKARPVCRSCENEARRAKNGSVSFTGNTIPSDEDMLSQFDVSLDSGKWGIKTKRISENEKGSFTKIITLEALKTEQAIQPVTISNTYKVQPYKTKNSYNYCLFLCDPQIGGVMDGQKYIPFNDRDAMHIALQVAIELQPKVIVWSGDLVDLAEFSTKYAITPQQRFTTQNALNETVWWLESFRRACPSSKMVITPGNHDCFSEDTEILTRQGWKLFSELKDTDLVGTLNKETRLIEYEKPNKIMKYSYSGSMYSIKNTNTDLMITPNHRIHYKHPTTSTWNTEEIQNVHIGNNRIQFQAAGLTKDSNVEYDITDDELRIVGWFVTDGSIDKHQTIKFYQRKSKVKLILDILDRLKWKYSYRERDRDVKEVCGKVLKKKPEIGCEITLLAGPSRDRLISLAPSKDLPEWTMELSERQFEVLLNAIIDGDGSRKKDAPNSFMLYGTKKFVEAVQLVCFHNNYKTSIYTYRDTQYRLNIYKGSILNLDNLSSHVEIVNYDGDIWCVNTPNDTVIVRRNDKISITGNSRWKLFLEKQAPQFAVLNHPKTGKSLSSLWNYLCVDDLDIEVTDDYPNGEFWLNPELKFIHGIKYSSESGKSVAKYLEDARCSTGFGHVHRAELATKTVWSYDGPKTYMAFTAGTLAKIGGKIPTAGDNHPNWQNSVGIISYDEHLFHVDLPLIIKNQMLWNGRLFKSEFDDSFIRKDLGF